MRTSTGGLKGKKCWKLSSFWLIVWLLVFKFLESQKHAQLLLSKNVYSLFKSEPQTFWPFEISQLFKNYLAGLGLSKKLYFEECETIP